MASPQLEDGYTKISNELLEALSMVQMSGSEWQYLMCLVRKTYGYNQKEAWVNNAYVGIASGLPKQRVSEAKLRLIAKNIVTEKRDKISLNKDYESWGLSRKSGLTVTEKRVEASRKSVSIKEKRKYIKHTEQSSESLLTSKGNNMGWNNKGDDYDEGVVDYDGDGTVKSEKRAPTKKYPNAQVVIKLFLEVLGVNQSFWGRSPAMLEACERLYTERGVEKIRNALEFYKEHKDDKYCPQITSPKKLEEKYADLSAYKTKLQ